MSKMPLISPEDVAVHLGTALLVSDVLFPMADGILHCVTHVEAGPGGPSVSPSVLLTLDNGQRFALTVAAA